MYTFSSKIRYSETDEDLRLTVKGLIDYFQDCSTFQTHDAGAGFDWLQAQRLAWVLSGWQIEIARLPILYEDVVVGTVPYALKGFFGLRNYFLDTKEGERCAVANSVWALMDMDRMVPARISEAHLARYTLSERLPMEAYLDRKIALPKEIEKRAAQEIVVHRQHLDVNRHVNNGQYLDIALDALEEVSGTRPKIRRLRAEYKKQARLSDTLSPVVYLGSDAQGRRVDTIDLRLRDASCCVVEILSEKA